MRLKDEGAAQSSRSITVKQEQAGRLSGLTSGIQRFDRDPCRSVSLAD